MRFRFEELGHKGFDLGVALLGNINCRQSETLGIGRVFCNCVWSGDDKNHSQQKKIKINIFIIVHLKKL